MSLHIANRMFVVTSSSEREIQLCIGDLTTLPKEEKVDVIMVSAFPNNYSATSASVLGALKSKLRLDVEELAYNHRKEDLRQNFSCWISKELPEHLPFRQLICFEKYRNIRTAQHLDLAIKDVFRAMMPIFNNENKSVITPLLATGAQVAQKPKMLRGMLNAAIEWMKFGLPLQLLKIVVYNVPEELKRELGAIFQEIKSRVELDRHPPKEPPKRHDVFLIYAKEDEEVASEMRNFLTAAKRRFMKYLGTANIITASDVVTKQSSGQHDIIMAMLGSSSVVPILTMSFMSDPSCLDQYNLALCANRRTKRNLLAPFCLDSIPDMPIYMTLVQWFNCRPRDSVKIQNACIVLTEQMKESFETTKVEYDIFVSYCHKNLDRAKVVVNSLKRENPAARIFFDQDELKTGQSWQQALYHSLDSAKCVIALISNDYMDSLVCNEELNVASAKHLSTTKSQELILIMLESTRKIPLFDYVKPVMADGSFEDLAGSVSYSVTKWLKSGSKDSLFSPVEYPMDIQDLTEKWRRHDLEANYFLSQNGIYVNDTTFDIMRGRSTKKDDLILYNSKTNADIFISYSLQDRRYASFLAWALARSPSNFSICSLSSSEANDTAQVDKARCVVVLLSLQYHRNPKKVEEFNYILSRVRKHRVIYVIFVDVLPTRPWYMRVVHCNTALTDDFWPDALATLTNSSKDGMIFTPEVNSAKTRIEKTQGPLLSREVLALLKATCDVENICLAVRNGRKTSVHMQKGIFFNIVDLKKSLEVRNTRKREFTIVASDYSDHNDDADGRLSKNHPNHHTADSDSSQHQQLSAENSEIHKSPDHGNSAKTKVYVPNNDNDIDNASFRSKDDAVVAKSPSSQYHDNNLSNDIVNASFITSRDDADAAKSPSPRYHDNRSPTDIANASFRSRDDADVAKSPSPRYHDNHSPEHNDPYSQASIGLSPDRADHAGYNPHQPVGQFGDREPSPAAAGGYHPQYSDPRYPRGDEPSPAAAGGYHPQYSDPRYPRGDEYGYDNRAENNNPDHPSDYRQNTLNTSDEDKKKKAKSSTTCTLL